MIPSTRSCWRTKESARKPELPAVRTWPLKKSFNLSTLIEPASSAAPLPANADATPTSATKPLLEAAGFVIANLNLPALAALAMSAQVTELEPDQPRLTATLCLTPSATDENMIGC